MTLLRELVVDIGNERSLAARARRRRMDWFLRTFPRVGEMHVLDLGGMAEFWTAAALRPAHVTVVNLVPQSVSAPGISSQVADACSLPDSLRAGFDLVVLQLAAGTRRRSPPTGAIR